jgi:DNA-binding NarL/FixJ family response regulator
MNELIRVLVADDHPLFREGVVHSLDAEPDFAVVGHVETSELALTETRELLPDVVLLDITMPARGGIVAAGEISAACPATKIIMLTASEHEDDLLAALKAGASGYVLKGVSARYLATIIRTVAGGAAYVSPKLAASILVELTQEKPENPLESLTAREKEILRLVAQGHTNHEIGLHLNLAEKTVKHYMTNVLRKLHVRSRVEAAVMVARRERQDLDR